MVMTTNVQRMNPGDHLAKGEHPHASELEACFPCKYVIKRNSIDFRTLLIDIDDVRLADAKDPVLNDNFRYHPCMRSTFTRLLDLAADEALTLRVIRAWDGRDTEKLEDLHGEGRAIDLTVENGTPADLELLAALGCQAGFDWIKHEGDHIHLSCRPYEYEK